MGANFRTKRADFSGFLVKMGFFEVFSRGDVDFWGKNGGWQVKLYGLGRIGKVKTFKND
ncbi:hypothetical protein ES703_80795 [subsurface metagenome]